MASFRREPSERARAARRQPARDRGRHEDQRALPPGARGRPRGRASRRAVPAGLREAVRALPRARRREGHRGLRLRARRGAARAQTRTGTAAPPADLARAGLSRRGGRARGGASPSGAGASRSARPGRADAHAGGGGAGGAADRPRLPLALGRSRPRPRRRPRAHHDRAAGLLGGGARGRRDRASTGCWPQGESQTLEAHGRDRALRGQRRRPQHPRERPPGPAARPQRRGAQEHRDHPPEPALARASRTARRPSPTATAASAPWRRHGATNPLVEQFRRGGVAARPAPHGRAGPAAAQAGGPRSSCGRTSSPTPTRACAAAAEKSLASFPAAELLPILRSRETPTGVLSWAVAHRPEHELREVGAAEHLARPTRRSRRSPPIAAAGARRARGHQPDPPAAPHVAARRAREQRRASATTRSGACASCARPSASARREPRRPPPRRRRRPPPPRQRRAGARAGDGARSATSS